VVFSSASAKMSKLQIHSLKTMTVASPAPMPPVARVVVSSYRHHGDPPRTNEHQGQTCASSPVQEGPVLIRFQARCHTALRVRCVCGFYHRYFLLAHRAGEKEFSTFSHLQVEEDARDHRGAGRQRQDGRPHASAGRRDSHGAGLWPRARPGRLDQQLAT
jgi:hypothetical protein